MKTKRILVLVREGLEPPENDEGLTDEKIRGAPWRTEYDVANSLKRLGHEVKILGVYDELNAIRNAVREFSPHLVFNMLEEFAGEVLYDQNVVTYLELLRIPYTGCNPRGLMIARDKALSKKLLAFHRIRSPAFQVFPAGRRIRRRPRLSFPLFVKSAIEDASLGISKASLVKTDQSLMDRIRFVHEHSGGDAIVEQFIEGRELYVGIIGNQRLDTYPVWELLFEKKGEDQPLIATAKVKWNLNYQKTWGVISRAAKDLPPGLEDKMKHLCKRIYRILGLSGYARLDFRLGEDGILYFLEANPNPQLAYGEDFAESAKTTGISYDALIQRIVSLGLRSL